MRGQHPRTTAMSRSLAIKNDHFELHHNGDVDIREEGCSA